VRTLFGVAGEEDEGGVIFLREELERDGVFEGVDDVFFGEF